MTVLRNNFQEYKHQKRENNDQKKNYSKNINGRRAIIGETNVEIKKIKQNETITSKIKKK